MNDINKGFSSPEFSQSEPCQKQDKINVEISNFVVSSERSRPEINLIHI